MDAAITSIAYVDNAPPPITGASAAAGIRIMMGFKATNVATVRSRTRSSILNAALVVAVMALSGANGPLLAAAFAYLDTWSCFTGPLRQIAVAWFLGFGPFVAIGILHRAIHPIGILENLGNIATAVFVYSVFAFGSCMFICFPADPGPLEVAAIRDRIQSQGLGPKLTLWAADEFRTHQSATPANTPYDSRSAQLVIPKWIGGSLPTDGEAFLRPDGIAICDGKVHIMIEEFSTTANSDSAHPYPGIAVYYVE